ncbi:hypothetical protein TNCV_1433131 [Trichonephila clavipes]|nr:hypothetical protein TNCV_1433131 [Trichonephila clavipes]
MIGLFIDPPYCIRGTVMELNLVVLVYFHKELMKLGRRQGVPCVDRLCSPMRDYWGRESGPPRALKDWLGSCQRSLIDLPHHPPGQYLFFFFKDTLPRRNDQDQMTGTATTF